MRQPSKHSHGVVTVERVHDFRCVAPIKPVDPVRPAWMSRTPPGQVKPLVVNEDVERVDARACALLWSRAGKRQCRDCTEA